MSIGWNCCIHFFILACQPGFRTYITYIDCLGRRLGPRLLGRADDSGQRLVRDFYKILNQVNTEELPDGLKLPDTFSQLVSEMKNKQYDAKTFAFMLRAMVRFILPQHILYFVYLLDEVCPES
ncbi:putative galacturonosyltransferase 13 [Vitis vinifera]|uniref:Putative galacturonosyltransferase 13 n=1 Tax=Vitis vinifera TaxID=29760 RepID=A0A438H973_VITVI|nr:putative galacturonosyltransferase 13 [Vitis vinifera]